ILRDWARSHPETAEAYRVRAAEFSEDAAKAKPILTEAMKKFPRDASFPFALAGFLAQEGKLKEAEALYVRAAELAPDAPQVQAWAGRFFFRVAPDDRRALEYYLNAYLLDPHAYETEFVESRIPKIHERLAAAAFRDQLKRGVPLTKLATDADPFVAGLALDEMSKRWSPAYTETLVADMAHDDGGVRWQAMELLKGKAGASFDATLRALLEDKDLRRRGLAAYLAVHRWKAASFDHLRRMLGDDTQLLRFDAVSALVMEGGPEGSRLVLEHAAREPNARLKSLIEKTLARQPSR
ncbi:MAG TPA: tetratricopeptide repeat protein, partial [Pyrinomonadaceae bacterium]|nr:tetratricopeptide repeat protein [Pyrinomonadaceae bacterium]